MKKSLLSGLAISLALSAYAGWSNDIESPVSLFPVNTNSYATDVVSTPDGGVWAMVYHPNTKNADDEYDTGNVVYEYRVQYFDPQGNPKFPEMGLLVSDYANWSYTVVNQYMASDTEGNLILSVLDSRNSNAGERSYTAYKISPDGEFLWGEDGKPITDPTQPAQFTACMRFVELSDHSFVFAWQEMDDVTNKIRLQRLDKDGNRTWKDGILAEPTDPTSYPYLVESGDNTFIMVFAKTASQILYARKMDFEGEKVWGKDVRIYRGGWGSVPIHTLITVKPSNNGGVIVGWTDDRTATNIEYAYMSYVTPDGKLAFSGASDEADCKLSYENIRKFNVSIVAAEDASCFYAIWRQTNSSQTWQGMKMQKVSLTGELLWGDEAKDLYPLEEGVSLGYVSLCNAEDNGACAFFEVYRNYFDQQCIASRFDEDGNYVWNDEFFYFSAPDRKASGLVAKNYIGNNSWLANWTDGGTSAEDKDVVYCMNIVNADGSLGVDPRGIKTIQNGKAHFVFDGKALSADLPDGTLVEILNAAGLKVAVSSFNSGKAPLNLGKGIYVARAGSRVIKFCVQ